MDVLLADVSKTFVCLFRDLLLARLHAYGFGLSTSKIIHSFLKTRKHWSKIDDIYSYWDEILFRVPQGSPLGYLLSNISLCDLIFSMHEADFTSYADGNTLYGTGDRIEDAITLIENNLIKLLKWFEENQMKANKGKCHPLISGSEY